MLFHETPASAFSISGGPLSHPIVHLSHQAGAILPQAEVEEEIRDTPLRNAQAPPSSQQSVVAPGAWPKDMPRLAFEITSEDGFSCRAQTMEGKRAWVLLSRTGIQWVMHQRTSELP